MWSMDTFGNSRTNPRYVNIVRDINRMDNSLNRERGGTVIVAIDDMLRLQMGECSCDRVAPERVQPENGQPTSCYFSALSRPKCLEHHAYLSFQHDAASLK